MLKNIVDQYALLGIGYREVSYLEIPVGVIQTFLDRLSKDKFYYGEPRVLRHVFRDLLCRDRYVFVCTNQNRETGLNVITLDKYDMRVFYNQRRRDWVSINGSKFVQN